MHRRNPVRGKPRCCGLATVMVPCPSTASVASVVFSGDRNVSAGVPIWKGGEGGGQLLRNARGWFDFCWCCDFVARGI